MYKAVRFTLKGTNVKKPNIRVPVPKRGVILHKPKKGKGSYRRNNKHKRPLELNLMAFCAFNLILGLFFHRCPKLFSSCHIS